MDYLDKDFGKILKNNAQTLRHDLLASGTDCFRVYDRNLSRYPVTVDLYGRYAKVTDYGTDPMSDDVRESCLDICARMLYLEPQNVVYAFRAKRVDRAQHEKTESEPVVTTVKENGLLFKVDLTSYVDTGLFLDHAVTRQLIRERSANADVLNLFSYTGSFSVYAAAGLANSVTSVDMSATYTRWAQENLAANGYSGDMYSCICMDAAKFVRDAEAKGLKYDIIIFDPPSFSNSHKMDGDFDVARDYALWVRNLLNILKKTGIILFSTNLGSFRMDKRRLRGLSIKEITGLVAAPGFVKDRAGTVRSWMMAFDDDSLSLDWSEPEKKSVKSSDRSERPERKDRPGRPYGREGERRSYGSSYGRRDRDRNDDRRSTYRRDDRRSTYRRDDRRDDRRERRDFDRGYERGNDRDGERPFRRERREDRPYSDRGYGRSYDRSERADRPERRFNREDREERKERGERSFGRSYDRDDRPERSRRSFDQKRSFQRDDSEGRPFRKSFDRKPFERKPFDGDRRSDSRRKGGSKPYGYDSFKPARSREDSNDFFWNAEDLDPKKRDDKD
ncbi:MAG: class I SAM-dependent methyltransferase [Spirochaetales bacterium]|nr:class I SAM-dependent methyltransferase [Spirochaetales bacterium]